MCPVCSTSSSVSGSVLSTLGQHSRAPLALPPPSFYFISFYFLLFFSHSHRPHRRQRRAPYVGQPDRRPPPEVILPCPSAIIIHGSCTSPRSMGRRLREEQNSFGSRQLAVRERLVVTHPSGEQHGLLCCCCRCDGCRRGRVRGRLTDGAV